MAVCLRLLAAALLLKTIGTAAREDRGEATWHLLSFLALASCHTLDSAIGLWLLTTYRPRQLFSFASISLLTIFLLTLLLSISRIF